MKVVIQSHAHTGIIPCDLQNLLILSLRHSDFGDMDGVNSVLAKNRCSNGSETLVQENPFHATRSMFSRSSFDRGCCIAQGLLVVLGFEKGVLGEDRGAVGISREEFENAPDGDPHPADAWLAAAFSRVDGNPIKQIYRGHVLSLDAESALR